MSKDKEELVQCRGLKPDTRDRCRKRTRDSSGYCRQHREQINTETEFAILKCDKCPVKDCRYKDHFNEGICYFEVADDVKDFDAQWKTITAMREMLRNERLIIGRLEREISRKNFGKIGTDEDDVSPLLKQLKDFIAIHSAHMMMFGKFMGYQANKSEEETDDTKRKQLEHLMSKEKKKDTDKKKAEEEEKKLVADIVKK